MEPDSFIIMFVHILSFILAFLIIFIITRYLVLNRLGSKFEPLVPRKMLFPLILLGIFLGMETAGVPRIEGVPERTIDILVLTGITLSISLVIIQAITGSITVWGREYGPATSSGLTGLAKFSLQLIILGIAIMVVLGTIGIEITPLLASLGILGLGIGLALQPTLSNLFAGIYIISGKPVRIGDYIMLETGERGYVKDIGWRNVRIQLISNDTILIPNQKLVDSIITNYYYPEPRGSLLVEVGVSYESDVWKVESVLVEEFVKASYEVEGMVTAREMRPFVRFIPGYGDSSLKFTVICHVREFVDRYYVEHEIRKRVWDRFEEEGIVIPFPIRTLHFPKKYITDLAELAGKEVGEFGE